MQEGAGRLFRHLPPLCRRLPLDALRLRLRFRLLPPASALAYLLDLPVPAAIGNDDSDASDDGPSWEARLGGS